MRRLVLTLSVVAVVSLLISSCSNKSPVSTAEPVQINAATAATPSTIQPGTKLDSNVCYWSLYGYSCLVFQGDGNLVLYRVDQAFVPNLTFENAVFASNTCHCPTEATQANECWFQADGNLVLYRRSGGTVTPIWHTGTYGNWYSKLHVWDYGWLRLMDSSNSTMIWEYPDNSHPFGYGNCY